MDLVPVICSMFVCVVPLSQPSSRDRVNPLLGCFVSEKSSIKKKKKNNDQKSHVLPFLNFFKLSIEHISPRRGSMQGGLPMFECVIHRL